MYHCFVRSSVMLVVIVCRSDGPLSGAAEPRVKPSHQGVENQVDPVEIHAEEDRRENDHERRGVDFFAARPRHATQFVADFRKKASRPTPPAGHALARPSTERVFVLRRNRLHFELPTPETRDPGRTHALPPTSYPKLAGQEGIEPPTPGFGDRCSAN